MRNSRTLSAAPSRHRRFQVADYDLDATLSSGQAFRWVRQGSAWEGVIGPHWVRLTSGTGYLEAEVAVPTTDWQWLAEYLQVSQDLAPILDRFPQDEIVRQAVTTCRGLRLLRQEPWECLASFLLSSCKQITQIQRVVTRLCQRFGAPLPVPAGHPPAFSFPSPARLADCGESALRACGMGFRAAYLKAVAQRISAGELDLGHLAGCAIEQGRAALMSLPGVGHKIANCVLLFAYGCQQAFPVDTWMRQVLEQYYFRRRRTQRADLERFGTLHFQPYAGYAQQYLFHYIRTRPRS